MSNQMSLSGPDLSFPISRSEIQSFSLSDPQNALKCMLPTNMLEEQPILVNPRRYERIIKRRIARDKQLVPQDTKKKGYLHESRHKHALSRERGPGGIFLSKSSEESLPKKKVKYSRYSAACVLYGMPPDD